jgi:hypothetical protein
LSGEAVGKYVEEWIVSIADGTGTMRIMDGYLIEGNFNAAKESSPEEEPYVLTKDL